MDNILDHVVVQGQSYDIVSPTAFGDYIETIGSACINPDGYAQGSTFLAKLGNEQFYYEATAAITQGSAILEGTNCKKTTVTGREAELAKEIETLGDNVTSLNEALSNEVDAIVNELSAKNIFDIEKWLTTVGLAYTKNGDTYTTSTGGQSYGTHFAFADKDIDVTISGIITVDTSNNVRVEVLNVSNEVVAAIKDGTTYASGKGSKIRLNWSVGGNFTIEKPMIRPASIEDDTYQPYAMTNRELTDAATPSSTSVSIPSTYSAGTSYLTFEKVNGIVTLQWSGSASKLPEQGTEYEIATIPTGYAPRNAVNAQFVDFNSFAKGIYISLRNGKVYIYGYNTGTNGLANCVPRVTYIV